jgi:hypothetical protein
MYVNRSGYVDVYDTYYYVLWLKTRVVDTVLKIKIWYYFYNNLFYDITKWNYINVEI